MGWFISDYLIKWQYILYFTIMTITPISYENQTCVQWQPEPFSNDNQIYFAYDNQVWGNQNPTPYT